MRSRFSPDVSFLSAKEREKRKREQTYLQNGTMFPSSIHPPETTADGQASKTVLASVPVRFGSFIPESRKVKHKVKADENVDVCRPMQGRERIRPRRVQSRRRRRNMSEKDDGENKEKNNYNDNNIRCGSRIDGTDGSYFPPRSPSLSLTHFSLFSSFCVSLPPSLCQSAGTNTGCSCDVTAHGGKALGGVDRLHTQATPPLQHA